jgi:hypothetical protein
MRSGEALRRGSYVTLTLSHTADSELADINAKSCLGLSQSRSQAGHLGSGALSISMQNLLWGQIRSGYLYILESLGAFPFLFYSYTRKKVFVGEVSVT